MSSTTSNEIISKDIKNKGEITDNEKGTTQQKDYPSGNKPVVVRLLLFLTSINKLMFLDRHVP